MLELAMLHQDAVTTAMVRTATDPQFKWYHCGPYASLTMGFAESTWEWMQFASVARGGDVVGYFSARVDRPANAVTSLSILNFTGKPNPTFARDMAEFFDQLFTKFGFDKVKWCVVVGNPAEHMYDRMVERYGGRVVGVFRNDVRLWDGGLYDLKHYELLREEYRRPVKGRAPADEVRARR